MGTLLFLMFMVAIVIGSVMWQNNRSREVLEHWAEENRFRIIEANFAAFLKGPFFWTASKGQTVYRVLVQDEAGRTRSGWVCCGSWMWGIWSDQAQVRWDEE